MRAQEFFQKAEELAAGLCSYSANRTAEVIRTTKNSVYDLYPANVKDWPDEWHKTAIQAAKHRFDFYGVEYVEGE
jgi:hypothetical protein